MANTFLEALHSGRVLLMDGAMGTELQRAGIQPGECYELWNLTHPERVLAIHRAYVEAGAEVLLTNTFQASTTRLVNLGLVQKSLEIWCAGWHLAKSVSDPPSYVLVSFGPGEWHWKQLDYMAIPNSHQASGLLLETYDALHSVPACIAAIHGPDSIPVLASLTYFHDENGQLKTFVGQTPETIAEKAKKMHGLAALGVNCGRDITMDDCIEIIRRYRAVTDLPLFARPNAGTPTKIDNQWVYPHTPEQMAAKLPELLEAGATMVGGCCGTTPAHIAAFRRVVDERNAKKHAARS